MTWHRPHAQCAPSSRNKAWISGGCTRYERCFERLKECTRFVWRMRAMNVGAQANCTMVVVLARVLRTYVRSTMVITQVLHVRLLHVWRTGRVSTIPPYRNRYHYITHSLTHSLLAGMYACMDFVHARKRTTPSRGRIGGLPWKSGATCGASRSKLTSGLTPPKRVCRPRRSQPAVAAATRRTSS